MRFINEVFEKCWRRVKLWAATPAKRRIINKTNKVTKNIAKENVKFMLAPTSEFSAEDCSELPSHLQASSAIYRPPRKLNSKLELPEYLLS